MFAIAFDLTVKETAKHHPKGVPAAYAEIGAALAAYGCRGVYRAASTSVRTMIWPTPWMP